MNKYNHQEVEKKIQKIWETKNVFDIDKEKEGQKGNFYILDMWPYPSAEGFHMGHTLAYTATDIFYRYKKMNGFNVLHPQGFDAFGLPAENFAIKTGIHPKISTAKNIENFLRQWKSLGLGHDFKNLINSSLPEYYKHTQSLFGKFFQNNFIERKTGTMNWCPSCYTGISSEQVEKGSCERCKTTVEQKKIPGWFFKITDFADDLINDLDKIDWPEHTKKNQKNWIGKSEGAEIEFSIKGNEEKIKVFTTRADTLFGVTFMVLAPEHNLVNSLKSQITNWEEVEKYILDTKKKTELERLENKQKTGVKLEGFFAVNPANQEEIPVYISDYVLEGYGTGAIMAVPGHDERDFEFAEKFNLEKKEVILNKENKLSNKNVVFIGVGQLINSGKFDGMESEEAKQEITKFVEGKTVSTYRLRDWSISRQRYWGCPIPIVYSPEGQAKFVGEENLPWVLPEDVDFIPDGVSPLVKSKELIERTEKIFGKGWKAEVDTMDTFVDSSWYFLRYPDTDNQQKFCSKERMDKWIPKGVNLYIGGAEHTYLHLLYSRFFVKAMKKMNLINFDEPFLKLKHQGFVNDKTGKKMSKSKGNVVSPDDIIKRFGADATRLHMMFSSPLEDEFAWNEDNIVGVYRFLEKVWFLKNKVSSKQNENIKKELHKLIKKVSEQIERLKYNTAVSDMMKFINFVFKEKEINIDDYQNFLILLSPFAPHIADNLSDKILLQEKWPELNQSLAKENLVKIGIQINGKRRAEIETILDEKEESLKKKVLEMSEVQKWIENNEIKKFIYIPGKIISIII